jgi:glycosyltransferase involved in cell wall biosynthesis
MPALFFTVVIPTYNRADLLPLSIQSVLDQTFQDFEIIVVDNFSSDNTPEVMRRYENDGRIFYFRNEKNMERGYSRNVGFRNGRGEFLTLLDSDDLMYPDCLRDAYEFSQQHKEAKVFHNLYEFVNQDGRPSDTKSFPPIDNQYKQICQGNFLSCIGVFLSKEVYNKFFFTEDLKMIGSEDYEIWFRILAHYKIARINKVNCGIREHLGRSVYSSMYENLEYQRRKLVELIEEDSVMRERYTEYKCFIDANYYFHEAMYSLHKKKKAEARQQFMNAVVKGKGFVFSKRFFAFIKNFLFK